MVKFIFLFYIPKAVKKQKIQQSIALQWIAGFFAAPTQWLRGVLVMS